MLRGALENSIGEGNIFGLSLRKLASMDARLVTGFARLHQLQQPSSEKHHEARQFVPSLESNGSSTVRLASSSAITTTFPGCQLYRATGLGTVAAERGRERERERER
jgi:hypothetical protein